MINIEYNGGLGNQLFQYSFGRLLSNATGLALRAPAIAGFLNLEHELQGHIVDTPLTTVTDGSIESPSSPKRLPVSRILIRGYFQRADYYSEHRSTIRTWFSFPEIHDRPDSDAVVVHIRRRDYIDLGWDLPEKYYRDAISRSGCKRVVILSDDLNDPFLKRFADLRPTLLSRGLIEDLAFMASATHLVISASSYSWWAAFLGHATSVYVPLPNYGIWDVASTKVRLVDPKWMAPIPVDGRDSLNWKEFCHVSKRRIVRFFKRQARCLWPSKPIREK